MHWLLLLQFIAVPVTLGSRIHSRNRATQEITEVKQAAESDGLLHIAPWKDLYGGFGTTQEERTWFLEQPSYKSIYPEYCNGHNFNDALLPIKMDGWSCIHKPLGGMGFGAFPGAMAKAQKHDRVGSIVNLNRWEGQRYICCAGSCRRKQDCGVEPLSFENATKAVLNTVHEMQTESGKVFNVYTLGCEEGDDDCEEPEQEEGVLATIDFRFDEDALSFEANSATPDEDGKVFLRELAEPLSLHASMLLTVLTEQRTVKNESLKLLFCAHGTLVETGEIPQPHLSDIPKERADVLTEHLKELALKEGTEKRPTVGTSHGHLQHVPGVAAITDLNMISLIMKVYEPSLFKPECKTKDLYAFLPDFDPTEFKDDAEQNGDEQGDEGDVEQNGEIPEDGQDVDVIEEDVSPPEDEEVISEGEEHAHEPDTEPKEDENDVEPED